MKVSSEKEDMLITYSLGSCIGLSLHDPKALIGGLIHCLLPLSGTAPDKAKDNPFMFTDTGVAALIDTLLRAGARKNRLIAKVAGGSNIMDENGMFKIGERNYTVVRKVLWKNDILIAAEDVGGKVSRTMALHIADGRTTIQSNKQIRELE